MLNLQDRQAWQKFGHILTSFVSDHIDLVAPEQIETRLEQKTLSLSFTLITVSPERDRANQFTHDLETFMQRLKLAGVKRVSLEFFAPDEQTPALQGSFELPYIKPPVTNDAAIVKSADSQESLARSGARANSKVNRRTGRGGSLTRRMRGWLTSSELRQSVDTNSKLAIRDPKRLLVNTKDAAIIKFTQAIDWVDTYPWEDWFAAKVQWQKRRHRRNLAKALFEDFMVLAVLATALFWLSGQLSGPTMNLALLADQHYDHSLDSPDYRCGRPGVNRKNYVCLDRGMSYRQVSSILGDEGKPLGIDHKFGDCASPNKDLCGVIITWRDGSRNMNATFSDDRLVAKAWRDMS
ncbi:hypothetical protein Pse7367_2840 [Thalassoporum mexicanum PCC 7367]|uniref:hypothetical protein n=1 Tax=Thalassoporum mexicanum TaxID=3457544 RepID=UPI00029FBA7B|nr:hypothetical protein [Pseudanabaena sp. PCC 7367]AFY71093.1 hypothetical protein Pse7367_2840 [Pseudanabaena sp. PCC 7367]